VKEYNVVHIAQNITSTCKHKGVTVKKMASSLGLGQNCISNMLHGRAPSVVTIARIADYLGVSVDYLLGRVSSPEEYYTPANIARNISEACNARRTTCAKMCASLGLPADTVSEEREISAGTLAKIADYLRTTTDKLVGR